MSVIVETAPSIFPSGALIGAALEETQSFRPFGGWKTIIIPCTVSPRRARYGGVSLGFTGFPSTVSILSSLILLSRFIRCSDHSQASSLQRVHARDESSES